MDDYQIKIESWPILVYQYESVMATQIDVDLQSNNLNYVVAN